MVKQILYDIKDELGETIGNVGKQAKQGAAGMVSDAGKQISGNPQSGDSGSLSPWEQIVGKPMDPGQFQQKQQEEQVKKQKNLNEIRANLKQLLEPPPQQQQEPPKYLKAEMEKRKKMQEDFEKEKKKPKDWAVTSATRMGSGETRGGQGVGG